jgi:hypothetical protein
VNAPLREEAAVTPCAAAARSAYISLGWFLGAWLFDYRGLQGDRLAPGLQISGMIVSAVCIWRFLVSGRELARPIRTLVRASLVFVGFTAIVGVVRGQAPTMIVTTALPLLLYVGALVLTYDALSLSEDVARIRSLILSIALCSVVLKPFIHYYTSGDVTVSEVRFQIVSGAMILVMAHCVAALFTTFRFKDMVIVSVVISILAAAVTRSYLLVAIGMLAFNALLSRGSVSTTRLLRAAFMVAFTLVLVSVTTADSCQVVVERWQDRLTKQEDLDYDITTASRLAEVAFQIETVTSSVDQMLFGSGIAAPTQGTGEYADFFFSLFPDEEFFSVGFGHNGPVSVVFVAGLFVGGIAILIMLWWLWCAGSFTKRFLRNATASREAFIGCWASTSIVGALVLSLSGGIFTQRTDSIYLGVSLGMLFWARQLLPRPDVSHSTGSHETH